MHSLVCKLLWNTFNCAIKGLYIWTGDSGWLVDSIICSWYHQELKPVQNGWAPSYHILFLPHVSTQILNTSHCVISCSICNHSWKLWTGECNASLETGGSCLRSQIVQGGSMSYTCLVAIQGIGWPALVELHWSASSTVASVLWSVWYWWYWVSLHFIIVAVFNLELLEYFSWKVQIIMNCDYHYPMSTMQQHTVRIMSCWQRYRETCLWK